MNPPRSDVASTPPVKLSAQERKQAKLGKRRLALAVEILRTDGYVVLEEVVPKSLA